MPLICKAIALPPHHQFWRNWVVNISDSSSLSHCLTVSLLMC